MEELDPRGGDWLTAMTQRLYHRGPNDGGAVVFGLGGMPAVPRSLGRPEEPVDWSRLPASVGLGARRLAVIDPSSAGHQPMVSQDGQVWIVFNGEIYNYQSLRGELRERGMVFHGESDTEVFLMAYRVWGHDCFARLEGMWAAAIVDWGARRAFLSRDRLGIKPLYLTRFERGIAFASEIKSLLLLPGAARGINEARLRDFLSQGIVDHTDGTLFDGIASMPPGCWAEFDLRIHTAVQNVGFLHRYWQPLSGWRDQPDAPARVLSGLRDAVRSHLRSDVPVGSCLSGGLDSSAVVSLVHGLSAQDAKATANWSQHTFTASLPGLPLDETRHAETVVQACPGLSWHCVTPTAERLLTDMQTLVWHQEQPFGSPSIYMQWEVMRLARETGVTVLLDGQGGDELFCGYEGHVPPYLADLLSHGRLGVFGREFREAAGRHFCCCSLAGHVAANMVSDGVRDYSRRFVQMWRQPWLAGELFSVDEPADFYRQMRLSPPEPLAVLQEGPASARRLWAILLRESLPSLLRFEDRNSMAFSIEARVPLLDRSLVEFAMALPTSRKISGGRLKAVLREAVQGVVPDSIIARRDKIGFSAPTLDWLRGGLREWWCDMLASKSFLDRGCFSAKHVRRLADRLLKGDASAALPIWRLAIVEQWSRQFLDNA